MTPSTAPVRPITLRRRLLAGNAWRSLHDDQFEFAAAILNPDWPVPPGLVGPDGEPSARRFAVYRNNVIVGLCETLKAAFPVVRRLVGDQFFSAMARIHVSREPPSSPIMLDYGGGFPDFIGTFEPAAGLPYLRDVARLERAWVEAYHSAEGQPLDWAAFSKLAPEQLAGLRFTFHPSVRLVRSTFPVLAIWEANIGDGMLHGIDLAAGGEDVLIVRPKFDVEMRALPAGGGAFLQALCSGSAIVDAADATLKAEPHFDLPGAIGRLIMSGAIVQYHLPRDETDRLAGSTQ